MRQQWRRRSNRHTKRLLAMYSIRRVFQQLSFDEKCDVSDYAYATLRDSKARYLVLTVARHEALPTGSWVPCLAGSQRALKRTVATIEASRDTAIYAIIDLHGNLRQQLPFLPTITSLSPA